MENQKTPEAIFVKEIDNIEAVFQAKLYQELNLNKKTLHLFKDYALKKIKTIQNKNILKKIPFKKSKITLKEFHNLDN